MKLGLALCSLVTLLAFDRAAAADDERLPIGTVGQHVPSRYRGVPLAITAGTGAAAATSSYVVQPGDTLWRIARRFSTTVEAIAAANGLGASTALKVGVALRVPAGPGPAAPAPQAQPNQGSVPPLAPQAVASAPAKATRAGSTQGYALRWPVDGPITSRFGRRGDKAHDGVDISAAKGTKVRAAGDGEVLFSGAHRGYGNLVLVRHSGGLITVYAHNDRNLAGKGQRVRTGQPIAVVGQTGQASGPHLHFEVRRGVVAENPLQFLPP